MIKSKKNIITILISLIFCISFLFLAGINPTYAEAPDIKFKPQVGIPDSKFEEGEVNMSNFEGTEAIGEYVKAIYTWAISIVGVLAATVLLIGGIIWLTAGGNTTRVETAKSWIAGSITGLVLALASYTLLYQINPDLVAFRITKIQDVSKETLKKDLGCCQIKEKECENTKEEDCEGTFKADSICNTSVGRCYTKDEGGCCGDKTQMYYSDYSHCEYVDSEEDCDNSEYYHKNTKCEDVGKCP